MMDLKRLEPDRVCIVKPSALGDVVHALPVLSALRGRWPEASFAWVVNRGLLGLLEGHPALDEVIPFDRPRARSLGASLRFLESLRRRRFDLTIDLQGLFRSGLITRWSGASVRVGRADAREGATRFYTHAIESEAVHAVSRLMSIASAFGAEASEPRSEPVIGEAARRSAADALRGLARPIVTFNLGARWMTKRWPPASFAAVARRASTELGASIVVVGAPEDRGLVESFRGALSAVGVESLDLCGRTSLPVLAAVAEGSDLFVSNDTGPLHLAAATGVRTLAVFLCTDPAKTGAFGAKASVVGTKVWCAASCVRTCDRLDCMSEVTPERVYAAAAEALGPGRARHARDVRLSVLG